MKRTLLILLALCMLFAFSSCAINKNGLAKQERAAIEYVSKYCGEATIVDRNSSLLNTITDFTFCDITDGFEYHVTTTEVYMSDLGFEAEDENIEEKTIFIDNYFVDAYLCYLLENKINGAELLETINSYPDLDISVVSREVIMTTYIGTEEATIETAFIMKEANADAAAALAKVLKKADTRNLLNQVTIPVYANRESNEVIAYYNFFFNRLYKVDEADGVSALHEYLFNSGVESAKIISIQTDYSVNKITVDDGFKWGKANSTGTYIVFSIDGIEYEYHTSTGIQKFDTEYDEYGIYEGSFLDIMASDRTGSRPLFIAMYAIMYPDDFQNLAVFCRQITTTEADE